MATVIGISVTQKPGMAGVEMTYSIEAIVDSPEDAHAQGIETFKLLDAFEDGFKKEAPE